MEYPFEPYFEQQVQELERVALPSEESRRPVEIEKKDVLARADTGGLPPPPVPGIIPGKCLLSYASSAGLTFSSAASSCAVVGDLK